MNRPVRLYSPKGGQGCTVVAALYALANGGALWSHDNDELRAALGVPSGTTGHISPTVSITDSLNEADVIDFGTTTPGDIMVVRNEYLALVRACRLDRPKGIVLVALDGASLQTHDVESVIGARVLARINVTPDIARAVDAGLLINHRAARAVLPSLRGLVVPS